MARTYDNVDIIPQDELKRLGEFVDQLKNLKAEIVSTIPEARKLFEEISKGSKTYKTFSENAEKFEQASEKVTAQMQKEQNIRQEITKIAQRNIQSNSEEAKSLENLRNWITDIIGARKENLTRLVQEQAALKGTQNSLKILEKEYQNGRIRIEEYTKRKGELIDSELRHKQAISEIQISLRSETKELQATSGSMVQMSQDLGKLRTAYRQLNEDQRNSPLGQQLRQEIQSLDADIKALDSSIGNSQRNVGNYSEGFSDLNRAISLVDPSLGSVTTKIRNVSFVKSSWIKVNQQLTKSLGVTTQTANFIQGAIVGLVVGGIYLAINAYRNWREEQERINELNSITTNSFKEIGIQSQRNAESDLSNLKILYSATQDLSRASEERLAAAKELQSLYPDYLGNLSQEEILAGNASSSYDKLTNSILATAKARATAEKITELSLKQLDIDEQVNDLLTEQNDLYIKILSSQNLFADQRIEAGASSDRISDINKELAKLNKESDSYQKTIERLIKTINVEDLLNGSSSNTKFDNTTRGKLLAAEEKARQDLALFIIKLNADTERQITQDTNKSYQERIEALQNYIESQENLIESRAHAQIDAVIDAAFDSGAYATREAAEQDSANQIQLIYAKMWAEIAKIDEEGERIQLSIIQSESEKQIKAIRDAAQNTIDAESDRLRELAQLYNQGGISSADYEKQKADITRQYAQERLQSEIDLLNRILELDSLTPEQREKYEQEVANVQISYNKFVNDTIVKQEEDAAKERERIERELAKRREQIIRELASSVSSIFSGLTQSRINDLDKQIDAVNDWATEESDRVARLEESGVISKEEAEARKAAIYQEAQQRQEELQRQQVEAQRRQAIFDRGIKVAEIVWATKKAIMEAVALSPLTAGQPWAGIAAGLGIAQVAAVLAQPLPQYKDGTPKDRSHPGGPAIVGDGGRPEMVIFPSGEIFKTPATDTWMSMPKGTIVKPDWNMAVQAMFAETKAKMMSAEAPQVVNNINLKQDKMETLSRKTFQAVDVGNHLTAKLIRTTKRSNKLKRNQIS